MTVPVPILARWLCAAWLAIAMATAALADAIPATAGQPLILDAKLIPDVEVGSKLQQLVDPSGKLGLQEVLSAPMQANWRPAPGFLRSAGYTDAAYWFRLPVRNPLAKDPVAAPVKVRAL